MTKTNPELITRLHQFMEYEARSCSMDFGYITPEYVYRMWVGVCRWRKSKREGIATFGKFTLHSVLHPS